jgi:hypothetical protein
MAFRSRYFLLKDRTIIPCPDISVWAREHEQGTRQIANDYVGSVRVSTIFLGLDHNYNDSQEPILFETMVFNEGSWSERRQDRCSTWEQAQGMHMTMLARVLSGRLEKE